MQIKFDSEEESLGIVVENMPNDTSLSARDGRWLVTRTMEGVWTVFIQDAERKAKMMGHIEPHADTMWYEDGYHAAEAISHGWHTAYGRVI